jgi:hypothetical protein
MNVTINKGHGPKVKLVEVVEVPAKPTTVTVELSLMQALLLAALAGRSTGSDNLPYGLRLALVDAGYEEQVNAAGELAQEAIAYRETGGYQSRNLSWHVVQSKLDALEASLEGA